jgi:hypothetical protein
MASSTLNVPVLRGKQPPAKTPAAATPSGAAAPTIKGAAPDEALHQYVRELAGAPAGYRAIWLRLSRLNPTFKREQHVQIACRVVEELIKHFTGRVFVRPNGDVVLISQELKDKIIRQTADLLRTVFAGDTATQQNADQLCAIYDLESDYPRFVAALLSPEKTPVRTPARRAEPAKPPRRAVARRAANQKTSKRLIVLLAGIALVALVEGFVAYRSSQSTWVFDTPDAQKRHQLRNSWTGEYSGR